MFKQFTSTARSFLTRATDGIYAILAPKRFLETRLNRIFSACITQKRPLYSLDKKLVSPTEEFLKKAKVKKDTTNNTIDTIEYGGYSCKLHPIKLDGNLVRNKNLATLYRIERDPNDNNKFKDKKERAVFIHTNGTIDTEECIPESTIMMKSQNVVISSLVWKHNNTRKGTPYYGINFACLPFNLIAAATAVIGSILSAIPYGAGKFCEWTSNKLNTNALKDKINANKQGVVNLTKSQERNIKIISATCNVMSFLSKAFLGTSNACISTTKIAESIILSPTIPITAITLDKALVTSKAKSLQQNFKEGASNLFSFKTEAELYNQPLEERVEKNVVEFHAGKSDDKKKVDTKSQESNPPKNKDKVTKSEKQQDNNLHQNIPSSKPDPTPDSGSKKQQQTR